MNKKLVFILYDSRSGSTLLSALLNRFRGISVSLESAFVSRIIEYAREKKEFDTNDLIIHLKEEVQFNELGMDLDALKYSFEQAGSKLFPKKLIEITIKQYFNKRDPDAECWIVKHPPYPYMSEVVEYLPEVRFLHIIRDGRAVFNSKKRTDSLSGNKMERNLLKAAWDWRLKLKKAEQYKDRVISIRYEDLVCDKKTTMQSILEELKISIRGRKITKDQSEYFLKIGEQQKGIHKNVSKYPRKKHVEKWKFELDHSEIDLYNYVNKECLLKHNYNVETVSGLQVRLTYTKVLISLLAQKIINVILLVGNPGRLKRKLYRNYFLLKNNKQTEHWE